MAVRLDEQAIVIAARTVLAFASKTRAAKRTAEEALELGSSAIDAIEKVLSSVDVTPDDGVNPGAADERVVTPIDSAAARRKLRRFGVELTRKR